MKTIVLLLSCIFVSCSDSNFKRVETLDDFRVLAIVADKPEVNPGDSVSLNLFISDAGQNEGRVLEANVSFCRDPGVAYGAEADCTFDPDKIEDTLSIDTTTAEFSNNKFTGLSDPVSVLIPADFLEQKSILEKTNGVSYLAIFNFEIDGKNQKYFKRLIVTERSTLNLNPVGGEILVNGLTFSGDVSKGDELEYKGNSEEAYTYINVDGVVETKTEDYSVAWYISDGEVNFAKTDPFEKTEINKLPEPPYVIIGVLRDDRGGVEVQRLTVP